MATHLNFNWKKSLIAVLVLLDAGFSSSAQDTLTVERLDYKFVTLEDGRMSPVNFLDETDVAGTFFPCNDTQFVEFCSSTGFSIWVDGRFVSENVGKDDCLHFSSMELCGYSERDTVFVSIVSESGLLGVTARTFDVIPESEETIFPKRRFQEDEFWKMGLIFCGIVLIANKLFFAKRFVYIPRLGESYAEKFLTVSNLVQLVIASLLGAFLWSFTKHSSFMDFFYVVGAVLFWWILKSVLTIVSGTLFRFRTQANWQANFLLQFWTIMFIALFGLVVIDDLFADGLLFTEERYRTALALLEGLFVLLALVIFRLQKGLKSLHRFIYLCTTEILPGVLIIQFFLE